MFCQPSPSDAPWNLQAFDIFSSQLNLLTLPDLPFGACRTALVGSLGIESPFGGGYSSVNPFRHWPLSVSTPLVDLFKAATFRQTPLPFG